MDIGDAFLLVDKSIDEHLWVVMSDPGANADEVVIVNLTSHDSPDKDASCILDVGDHPWIKHRTSVRYMDARITKESNLDQLVRSGALVPKEPASDQMLRKILTGAQATQFLPARHRRILEDQNLMDR